MPSERARRKDDTWTTDELNKALKGSRDDSRRRHRRDDEERTRRHRDDVNGDHDDRRRRHKEDERRSHRDASEDKRRHRKDRDERIELTEEERERQRRERRERKEKKESGGKPERREKKRETPLIEDDDRRHRDRDNENKKHRSDDRERRHKDDDDRRRRRDDNDDKHRRKDDDRRRRDDDDRRRPREDDDRRRRRDDDDRRRRDDDSRRRQRDDDGKKRQKEERSKHRDEDDRERRRRHRDDENEDERSQSRHRRHDSPQGRQLTEDDREKQRQERRDRKEKKDREKKGDDEKKDSGKDDRRHRDRNDDKPREKERNAKKKIRKKVVKKKSVSGRRKETKPESEEEEEVGGDDYNYDDEDFEDYDDDFEDDDDGGDDGGGNDDKPNEESSPNMDFGARVKDLDIKNLSEMDALMKAMDEENNRLANGSSRSVRSNRSVETDESEEAYRQPVSKPNRSKTFIDFVSAKQVVLSSKTASRTKKRGEDLLQMIELDKARYDMFDLPPVKEYEMYIRNFGRSNTKQAYVQTNEDNIERDIQTEEIDTKEKWTQYPSDDLLGVGGDGIDPEAAKDSQSLGHVDTGRLAGFMERAGQAIGMLLDEERGASDRSNQTSNKTNIGFSHGFSELASPKFMQDRHVTHACFCPNQPNMLLTVFSAPSQLSSDNAVDRHGLICAWNVTDLSYPHRILCCEAQPTCCCFSPNKASLAFAGLHDGSVTVWDLREVMSMHRRVTVDDQEHVLRFPTYNTARVLEDDNHHSPVTTILPVHSTQLGSKSNESSDTSTGLSFQLATVEQNGIVNLWVVTEISSPDMAGSEVDLGLAPGGRIKLLKSSSITLHSPLRSIGSKGDIQAFEMQLLPSDLNHFYVGTDTGSVIHGVRFGSRGYPHSYAPVVESPVNVTTIDFSPFGSPYMLTGCDDGALYLYHTKSGSPLISWPVFCKGCGVSCVRWSRSRPTVFYVLDEGSTIHVMDLLESDSQPIQRDQITQGRAMTMCLNNDLKQGGASRAQLVLCLDNGRTEVHNIIRQLTEVKTLEEDFLEKYVDKF